MVVFLEKLHEIIGFLNANPIHYALTVNPTIYTSCIEQFRATAKVKMVNGERQIQALVDKKKVIITETSIRSNLHLEYADEKKKQKKQSRMKQKKNTEVPHPSDSTDDVPNKEHVPTHSNDPLLSELDEELAREIEAEKQAELERILKERVAQEEASRAAIYEE
ncbi:hypothetical protein Tco_0796153 [Tanacetum coccineum]